MMPKQQQQPSRGFVVVASKKIAFYYSAINLIESILDYMPDAQFAFFCEPWMRDHRCEDPNIQLFDCGDHIREKLYGMANSPFDHTFYIDADCECCHEDIVTIWDQFEGDDIKFVELTKDEVAQKSFVEVNARIPSIDADIDLRLCGGVCLYDNSNPLVKEFIRDWYEKYLIQEAIGEAKEYGLTNVWFPPDTPRSMLRWDQFTLWWMTTMEDKYKDLKIGIFKENYRWNWFTSFRIGSDGKHRLVDKPPVIVHNSANMNKDAAY